MVSKTGSPSASPLRRIEPLAYESRAAPTSESTPARSTASPQVSKSLLELATNQASASPDIDAARVNEIKTAISQGEFKIDPKAVAGAFLKMESE